MQDMCLFGSQGSGSMAVEMALRAVGQPYEVVRASEWESDSDQAGLRQANPLGQIPTLVLSDGTVLTESAAILIHLALCHLDAQLLPAEVSPRALALRGLVFIAANCYSAVSISDYPARWTTATQASAHEAVRQAARANLHRHWACFADQFGAAGLLAPGGVPGALAFLAVVVSAWSGSRAYLAAERPAFHALLLSLSAHPRLAEVLTAHGRQP